MRPLFICILVLFLTGCAATPKVLSPDQLRQFIYDVKLHALDEYAASQPKNKPSQKPETGTRKRFEKGEQIGRVQERGKPSQCCNALFESAQRSYLKGKFALAESSFKEILSKEPDNIFAMEAYAQSLYWQEEKHKKGCDIYKKIIKKLDEQFTEIGEKPTIRLDVWFPESYWKLGTCYLDEKEYQKAAFEISRAFLLFRSIGTPRLEPLSQALCFLAEAYFEKGDMEWSSYYLSKGLTLDPNQPTCVKYKKRHAETGG